MKIIFARYFADDLVAEDIVYLVSGDLVACDVVAGVVLQLVAANL